MYKGQYNYTPQNDLANRLRVPPRLTVPYSRFANFFKYEEPEAWAQNDILLNLIFFAAADRRDAQMGKNALSNFCSVYESNDHQTDEEIIECVYLLMKTGQALTKYQLNQKYLFFKEGNNAMLAEGEPFTKFIEKVLQKTPNQFSDKEEFVQFIKSILVGDETSGKCYNPDVVEMFRQIDVDGSKVITYDEFVAYYKAHNRILSKNDELIRLMFTIIDSDGSGEIDLDEFSVFAIAYQNYNIESEPGLFRCIFFMIDADHSGELDYDEMKKVLLRFYKGSTENDFKMLMKSIDRDHNGNISFVEFLRIFDVQYL